MPHLVDIQPTYMQIFDQIRGSLWWPVLHHDVYTWCYHCHARQYRTTAHDHKKMAIGQVPVKYPFQRVSIDLVEDESDFLALLEQRLDRSFRHRLHDAMRVPCAHPE